LRAWAMELGINIDMVYSRIRKGWDMKEAVITPKLR